MCLDHIKQIVNTLPDMADKIDVAYSTARLIQDAGVDLDDTAAMEYLKYVRATDQEDHIEQRRQVALRQIIGLVRKEAEKHPEGRLPDPDRRNYAAALDRFANHAAVEGTSHEQASRFRNLLDSASSGLLSAALTARPRYAGGGI